jgi:hypothetical protein
MAGELKGKLYEAILKLVLSNIFAKNSTTNKVFWETVPDGMSIKPDFTVGPNADQPKLTFLVSHGGSVNESNRKYWRNCGELVETKLFLKSKPRVISIYFDAHIKEDIKLAEKATFDASLIVGDQEYGDKLIKWVDDNIASYPKGKEECAEMLKNDVKHYHGVGDWPSAFGIFEINGVGFPTCFNQLLINQNPRFGFVEL